MVELETAFAERRTVVPVLVQGAEMPTRHDLPLALEPLTACQAHRVALGPGWARDVNALAEHIRPGRRSRAPSRACCGPGRARARTWCEPGLRPRGPRRLSGKEVIVLGPEFNGAGGEDERP